MKKVLAIHFSQSGQLTEIVENFCGQFENVSIDYKFIEPVKDIPFPWTSDVFFDTMPECVQERPVAIKPIAYAEENYDLIVIGYQPWFLSPSLPITSLLRDPEFIAKMNGVPVITVIGSRNMWLNSQESIRKLVKDAGGKLVGNVALADRAGNLTGVITIFHWMLTGQKTRKWGIFPYPGVSAEDIEGVKKYGKIADEAFQKDDLGNLQPKIIEKGGVYINTNILFIEGKAKKIFRVWANLIDKMAAKGKRTFWVNAFKYYLMFVLFVVSPILLLLYNVLVYPFTQKSLKRKISYFQNV